MSRELTPPPINPEWSADVLLWCESGLKSDIAWGYTLVGEIARFSRGAVRRQMSPLD